MPRKMILPRMGDRYGRWVVVADAGFIPRDGGKLRPVALCKCDCGVERKVTLVSLRCGGSLSCGCLVVDRTKMCNIKHGYRDHPAYPLYGWVYSRCYNKNMKCYSSYGGRGISMCREWKGNSESFLNWCLSNGWEKGLQIDRINNDAGYSPDNCRFTSAKINAQNRRSSKTWSVKGISFKSATDAANHYGVSITTIGRWCQGKMENGKLTGNRNDCYSTNKYEKGDANVNSQ